MFVELDKTRWNDAYCGKTLRVFCMGPADPDVTQACKPYSSHSVDVTIVGRCDDCEEATMDLSKDAFDAIAYEDAGRVKVGYQWI